MTSKIPSNRPYCATCTRWCGWTSTDFFRQWVEYETHGTGRCAGGGFNGIEMPSLSFVTSGSSVTSDGYLRTGFTCLFYGAPGTGKTETVYQIARVSGRRDIPSEIS